MCYSLLLVALTLGVHGNESPCVSDDRLAQITDDQIAARLHALAQNPSTSWMMQQTTNPDASKIPQLKKAFYINLQRNAFRRGRLTQLLKVISPDMPLERFSAVTRDEAKKADLTEFTDKGVADYMPKVYLGHTVWATVGVYLSHARLLKKIMTENPESNDMFLILEDDVLLEPDWRNKFAERLRHVPEDWDMIRIGYGTDSHLRCEDKVNSQIYENREPTRSKDNSQGFYIGNTAYIVRPKSIPRILKQLSALPVMDVDGVMMSQEGGMRVYGLSEPLVAHGNGIGFSDRMNPLSSLLQVEKESVSLSDIADKGIQGHQDADKDTPDEMAFDTFQEDLPDDL